MVVVRVAYTIEQCWHRVPGGTAVAAIEVAGELAARPGIDLVGVSARHDGPPSAGFIPPIPVHPLGRGSSRSLYASWLWTGRPFVESTVGEVSVTHATTIIPPPTKAPLVVTIHDLAFVRAPQQFSPWGRAIFRRSLTQVARRAALVLCSSTATMADCETAGISPHRLRLVPLGVRLRTPSSDEVTAVRRRFGLPDRYILFVGTLEPRKNLRRLVEAMSHLADPLPLVVAGPAGWGDGAPPPARTPVLLLGNVSGAERDALYAGAAVFCYPSVWEGFGLPVLEAMAAGTPVVTTAATSTEEVAGGAAVLVDALDVRDIARGIDEALDRREGLITAGLARAAACPWARTADLTLAAYREVAR